METTARGDGILQVPEQKLKIGTLGNTDKRDVMQCFWYIAAYAQLSGTVLPRPVDLKADDAGAVDGMVLAVDDAFDDEAMIAVEQILDRLGNTEARVYVVVQTLSKNNKQADEVLDRLYRACILRDLPWCGGIVVCTGAGIAALRHSPRMGLLRRPFSEAMDKLVGAARIGCSIEHAQLLGGGNAGSVDTDGMVRVKPALPAPIWRTIIKHLGAHAQSNI